MERIKYVFVFAFLMAIFPLVSKADCSYERQASLSKIASNVQFNYTYDKESDISFNVLITNLTDDIYLVDGDNNVISGAGEKSLNYFPGQKIEYTIFSNDDSCRGDVIQKRYVNLPVYNTYSTLDVCKENPGFSLCGMWVDLTGYTYEQFIDELEKYKNDKNKSVSKDTNKLSFWDFVSENKMTFIIIFIAIIILVFAFLFVRSKREVRR